MERHYPSDVSDAEWALLEPFFIDPQCATQARVQRDPGVCAPLV
jgi:transposase